MTIPIERPNLPSPPKTAKEMELEDRVKQLERVLTNLINSLNKYAFTPSEYAESEALTITEIASGLNTGSLIIWSGIAAGGGKPADNATVGAVWGSSPNLTGIPKYLGGTDTGYTGTMPSSGSGLQITSDHLGYYGAVKKLQGTLSGNPNKGEKFTQATSGATGICVDYYNSSGTDDLYLNVLSGTFDSTHVSTGVVSGVTMTPSGVVADAVRPTVFIGSDGHFYFNGNGSNYISWDGSNINILCTGGRIGSDTDHFDITNHHLQLKHSSTSVYMYLSGSGITWSTALDAGGTVYQSVSEYGIHQYADDATSISTLLAMDDAVGGQPILMTVYADNASGHYDYCFGLTSGAHIRYTHDVTPAALIDSFNLKKCIVTTDTNATEGALRYNTTLHKLQVYTTAWETITSV